MDIIYSPKYRTLDITSHVGRNCPPEKAISRQIYRWINQGRIILEDIPHRVSQLTLLFNADLDEVELSTKLSHYHSPKVYRHIQAQRSKLGVAKRRANRDARFRKFKAHWATRDFNLSTRQALMLIADELGVSLRTAYYYVKMYAKSLVPKEQSGFLVELSDNTVQLNLDELLGEKDVYHSSPLDELRLPLRDEHL